MIDLAIMVFILFTVGTYLIFEKHLLSILFGIAVLSNGANLFLLSMSGPPDNLSSPFVSLTKTKNMVDPLPQALILTAIVIGSGILVYLIAYIVRMAKETDSSEIEKIINFRPKKKDEHS